MSNIPKMGQLPTPGSFYSRLNQWGAPEVFMGFVEFLGDVMGFV